MPVDAAGRQARRRRSTRTQRCRAMLAAAAVADLWLIALPAVSPAAAAPGAGPLARIASAAARTAVPGSAQFVTRPRIAAAGSGLQQA